VDSKDFENELGPLPESDENARLQRESFKALQRLLSYRDSLIYRDERVEDFGIDCSLELKVGKYVTNFRSQAQVKATARVTMTQEGYVSFSVETANLNLLLNGTCPAYLLWEEASDEFWYTWARDQYTRLSTENPTWQSQKKITLQFRTKLTSDTLSDFEQKILDEGRFNRGLQDLIALGEQIATSTALPPITPAVQQTVLLLSRLGAGSQPVQRPSVPTGAAEFERLCLELLRLHWSRPDLELFVKPGERNYGIDIIDLSGRGAVYAARIHTGRSKDHIVEPLYVDSAIAAAGGFRPAIGKFGLLTQGDFSSDAQRRVRELNELHRAAGVLEVELFNGKKISELMQLYPEVSRQFGPEQLAIGPAVITPDPVRVPARTEPVAPAPAGSVIDELIDEARDAVNANSYQIAILLLNRIEQQKGSELTEYQRFRVISNRAFAVLGQGDPNQASKYLLEALALQPGDEKARINEVLAYYIVNDPKKAFEKAEKLRPEYPNSTRLASYWILASPVEMPTKDCEDALPAEMLSDVPVRVALANKALMLHEQLRAERHALFAATLAPSDPQVQLTLTKIYIEELADIEAGRIAALGKTRDELLSLAESHGYEAVRLAEFSKDLRTELESRVQLSTVLLIQGKTEPAAKQSNKAYQASPDNVQALLSRARGQFAASQPEAGIALLERAYAVGNDAEVALFYGNALLTRSRDKDLDIAVEVLTGIDLGTVVPLMRHSVALQTLRALMEKRDWGRGSQYLDSASQYLEADSEAALRGTLAHYQGLQQDAEEYARRSRSRLSASSSLELKVFLGRLFMLVGLPGDALPLFKAAFDAGMPSFDYGMYLDCAARLARDGEIIEAFRTLQSRGVDDWHTVEFGVQYLQKYDPQEAVDALDAFLTRHPDHRLALLSRSVIGVFTHRPELVTTALDRLPSVDELPVANVVQVIFVLRFARKPDTAVDYAYRFLRNHFNEAHAHRALLISMTPFDPAPTFSPTLPTVVVGAAVMFQELPAGSPQWRVIEETTNPSLAFDEISSDSKLSRELLGKQVGDTFQIAPGMIERRGTVLQIVPKYVRRYNDSQENWQLRFSEEPMVEAVHLGSTEEQVNESFGKILKTLERRAELQVQMRQAYSTHATPLHIYGSWLGKNAYVAMIALSGEKGQPVRVSLGKMEERNEAMTALRTAAALVVDLSTLAVLRLLELTHVLTTNRLRFLITEGGLREIRETLSHPATESSPSISIQFVEGRQVAYEETVEYKKERAKADREFLALVEKHCERIPVLELASYNSPKREVMEKSFGQYGLEAMILAAKPDHMLWTDDLVQAQLATTEFGARRVWTQMVLIFLAELGLLAPKERDRAAAKMVGMQYQTMFFDAPAILEAVELTRARPTESPLKNFVDEVALPTADMNVMFPILIELILQLYREDFSADKRYQVTVAFLDAIWKHSNARSSLQNLRANTQRLFGLNHVGKEQFDDCFDRWLKLMENPIIPG
jgi:tetratricopeptide (TPR) repeat protein